MSMPCTYRLVPLCRNLKVIFGISPDYPLGRSWFIPAAVPVEPLVGNRSLRLKLGQTLIERSQAVTNGVQATCILLEA